jgi:hypothetical protein
MYGTTTGSGPDPYVSSGAFDSRANFSADATNYIGKPL